MIVVVVAWAILLGLATAAVVRRERDDIWWLHELAALEVEAHARAIPVVIAGIERQRQPLGNGALQIEEGIFFESTGFVVVAPGGPLTIEPGQHVTLIAATAVIDDGTVTLPATTELLLYRPIRGPRRAAPASMRFRLALVTEERGTVLADRGLRLFRGYAQEHRTSWIRVALVALAAVHVAIHATELPWALVLAAWLAALVYDANQDFATSSRVVRGEHDPRAWPDAVERARAQR
jgi:hypothetical protein